MPPRAPQQPPLPLLPWLPGAALSTSPSLGRRPRRRRGWTSTPCSSATRSASRRCWCCQRTPLAGRAAGPPAHPRRARLLAYATPLLRGLCSCARSAPGPARPCLCHPHAATAGRAASRTPASMPARAAPRGEGQEGHSREEGAESTPARAARRGEGRRREEGARKERRGGAAGVQ
jgi:hypothetical protein